MARPTTEYLEWSIKKALLVFLSTFLLAILLIPAFFFASTNVIGFKPTVLMLVLAISPVATIPFIYLKLGADSTFDNSAYLDEAGVSGVLRHLIVGLGASVFVAAIAFGIRDAVPQVVVWIFGPVYSIVAGVFAVAYLAKDHYDDGVHPFLAGLLHRP